jgi:hypothetical protein
MAAFIKKYPGFAIKGEREVKFYVIYVRIK